LNLGYHRPLAEKASTRVVAHRVGAFETVLKQALRELARVT